jgi:hypothetical protein
MRNKDKFEFFRVGVVAGLIEKEKIINWADQELLTNDTPDPEVVEVSLAGGLSYSQIAGLLNTFNGPPDHDLPIKMLLAYALTIVQDNIDQTKKTIQGIRLIKAEPRIDSGIIQGLSKLEEGLDRHLNGELSIENLHADLLQFLSQYAEYNNEVNQVFIT